MIPKTVLVKVGVVPVPDGPYGKAACSNTSIQEYEQSGRSLNTYVFSFPAHVCNHQV